MDISILKEFWRIYRHPRLWIVLCLGFSSGLPLLLTASTLTLWLDEAGISRAAIGLFAAVATPYSLKFLWSPLMDSLRFPLLCRWLGQRTGWMVATQAGLILSIVAMAFANPADNAYLTALLAVLVAVFSASQDIVIDAYRVEYLEPEQQAAGAAMIVLGYRIGMIASGAGALYLAAYFGWQVSYLVMAALVMVGTVTVLIAGEPPRHRDASALESRDLGSWIKEAVIRPFTDFMQHNRWLAILCFILLYKMADAFMGTMAYVFYKDMGFDLVEIANISKLYGAIASIIGSLFGGVLVYRLGMYRSLWLCGILYGLSNLMFLALARVGYDTSFFVLTITVENFCSGLGAAIFVAYISSMCNLHFTATQYALLSSLASAGRTWLSTPAGWLSQTMGWQFFFFFSALLAIPGLLFLWVLRHDIKQQRTVTQ